jgi:hypothetical protein
MWYNTAGRSDSDTRGLIRLLTPKIAAGPERTEARGRDSISWPRDNYLNIWVRNMANNPLGSPDRWRDGVGIYYTCSGASGTAKSPFGKVRTATAEVGHWLDLLHLGETITGSARG